MVLIILSSVGFSYGEAFVASFLPGLGPPQDLGKISGYAWGLGYFGGLASTAIVLFGFHAGVYTLNNFSNLRLVGPVTGLFFLVAAIPTFLWVRDRTVPKILPDGETYFSAGFKRLNRTFSDIRDYKDLVIILASFFFAYAGLSIIIAFAFIYGDQIIKWSSTSQTFMFIITQITAAGGAFLFGNIQDKWGAKKTFIITLMLWFITIFLIYGVDDITNLINNLCHISLKNEHLFLIIGSIAGLGMGSMQSACRAMVGLFSPETKAGEFFGLWSFSNRLAAVLGLISLGILQNLFGLRKAILVCSIFFIIAVVIAIFVNETRGRLVAQQHEGE
jgi:UMF1 family MFS transporter